MDTKGLHFLMGLRARKNQRRIGFWDYGLPIAIIEHLFSVHLTECRLLKEMDLEFQRENMILSHLTIYLFIFAQVTFTADNCQPCKSVEGEGNGKPNMMKSQICQVAHNILLKSKSKFDSKRNHFDFPRENTFLKNTLFSNKRNINSRNLYFIRKIKRDHYIKVKSQLRRRGEK